MISLPKFTIFTTFAVMGCSSSHATMMLEQNNERSELRGDTKHNLRRVQEEVIYEDVPEMSDADIKSVMEWIAAEVGMVKNPFCWKDSYGRGVGTIPGRVSDCPSGHTNDGLTCRRGPHDISAPSKVASCPSGYTNMGYTCFRGVHSIHAPSRVASCPSGYTNMGLTCHRWWPPHTLSGGTSRFTCPSGYFKSSISHRCHKNCPSGYRNDGEFCTRHAHSLGMSSMKCPNGYFQSKATARCHKNCPSGYTNMGETCHRPVSIKGLESMSCKEGERSGVGGARCYPKHGDCFNNGELDAGLCYPRCRDSFDGVGPVCWGLCDNSMVNCGLACAKSSSECALAVADQVISTLVLAANIASLGLATPATAGATTTIRVGGKTVAGTTKVGKALVFAVKNLQTVKPDGLAKGATVVQRIIKAKTGTVLKQVKTTVKIGASTYKAMKQYRDTFADNFADQTSTEIERELDSHFHPTTARFLKGLWGERMINDLAEANAWQLASTTLAAASIVDISGVTGVVSAYAKPVCHKIVHFPCTCADLKCNRNDCVAAPTPSPPTNYALGKPTTQSNTSHGGVASRAVDGNTSGSWGSGSITHTLGMSNPSWSVDLKSLIEITSIKVYNRQDCCSNRLSGFKVIIWNGTKQAWTYTFSGGTPKHLTSINVPRIKGDKVQIMLPGSKRILSLAEVEVFGSIVPRPSPIQFRGARNANGIVTQPSYIQVSGGGWNKVHCASTSRILQDGDTFTVRGNKLQVGVGICIDSQELMGGKCGIRFNHNCVGFYGDNRNLMFAADNTGKEYKISADNYMSSTQGFIYDKKGNCVKHVSSVTKKCIPLPSHFKDKPVRATGQVWNSARATII